MAFNITTARALVRDSAVTSSSSTVWTDRRIDQAIMAVMDWANTRYKLITSTGTASTTNVATDEPSSWTSNVVTLTTGAVHGLSVGDSVNISGITPSGYNGQYTVVSVPTTTTLTYALTTDPGTYLSDGTLSLINLDLSGILSTLNRRRFIRARTGLKKPLHHVNWHSMIEWHVAATGQGPPVRIAFDTTSTTKPLLHPAPDSTGYTFTITYLDYPRTWTAGGTPSPDSFNIDDDLLRPMLYWGACSLMQHNPGDRKRVSTDPKWLEMVDHLDTILHDTRDLGIDQMVPDD